MKIETIKVLLIEDDEDDFILTRDLLAEVKGGNYALDWASSYEEGLKVAGRGEHHVCLVDYRLGELSGVQLIRAARDLGITTPMILLTGQGNYDVDVEAIEAGATDYLIKDETHASRLERTIRYAVELNTERCRAEVELTERKLVELELEHARDAALESVRLKSEFLANMSHEIRTPMNVIIGTAELALETNLDAQQSRYINSIALAAESLLVIIDDILDFSKIEAGKLSFETIDFDLRSTVQSVMELMAERVRAKELEMTLSFDADVPAKLRGDPTRLRQVLTNLLGNAVKFTERGKVEIRISKESEKDKRVTIRFDVQDTGIGISENDQRALFAPFVQADGSVTRRYGGTGLGLAIAKQLVEMMGGTISLTSEPGYGSTFSCTGSFSKQPQSELTAQLTPQPNEGNLRHMPIRRGGLSAVSSAKTAGLRGINEPVTQHDVNQTKVSLDRSVLLVEDNEVNQTVASDQLARLGCKVDLAGNGQEALDALALRSYDVVLMDCGMPVMDGYTATAQIRRRENGLTHTPIIAMTAHAMNGDRERCLAAGMDDYLSKPVKRKTLEAIFATLFGNDHFPPTQYVAEVPTTIATTDNSALINVTCLQETASTPEKLRNIIELYLRHTAERLEELKTALHQKSADHVYAIAHKCLGSSRTCGMNAIVPALTELQRMGKAGELNGAADQFNVAQQAFKKLQTFLETYLKQLPA
ncbi:MAG: two-component system, sensor histidine kinase and response regulator [Pyrinomonadaceae bacterium]|nr:two-component system, sensor histidine kinase and response regulator [Pyrinomonadaceae bacterium]